MGNTSIGVRIRELRGRVITQQQLADRAGVSVDLVRKLEQGIRQTASIGSLQRIARALDVDISELLGRPAGIPSTDPDAGIVAVRRVLTSVDDLLDDGDPTPGEASTLVDARRIVEYAWGAYWSGRYALLSAVLAPTLHQLRATARAANEGERAAAAELLARGLWVTGCSLVHLGQHDAAFLAVRQALAAAQGGSDELLSATLRGSVAWQLLGRGRYEEARRLAVRTAEAIEPLGDAPPTHLSAFGSLVLTAATAAARDQRSAEAAHLVGQADAVARRIGHDRRDYETYFGPSQVAMQRVDVAVVTEDYTTALTVARRMPRTPALPLASRARHLADRALAHARLGHQQQALDILLSAERMAPDWMSHQTMPRRIVSELLARERPSRLRGLAERLGIFG
ncbi:transcriptional regulator [Actinoalloteichus sp. AHMU CJ021]|uniref:helix-turn-helix domain-containing protein n=1 Tax=Actinoalloteichus sp. AHMU CJ021 TaxID=2072503 RepID=UPI000CA00852|nr:transcriptional regulator [Actinoalloteichus sp. AHMU CJ021]